MGPSLPLPPAPRVSFPVGLVEKYLPRASFEALPYFSALPPTTPPPPPGGLVARRADGLGAVRSPRIYEGSYSHIVPTEGVWLRGRAWHVTPSPSGAAARGTERMVNE